METHSSPDHPLSAKQREEAMVRRHIDHITDEMILGESIVLPSGELLLGAGYKIKERYRKRLQELGFTEVLIQEEGTEEVMPETLISPATQREMLQSIKSTGKDVEQLSRQFRNKGAKAVEKVIKENRQYLGKYLMNSGLVNAVEKFIEEIMSQSDLVLNLSAMHQTSEELFAHTMNVTITSLCLGRKFNFSYEELKQLAVGALHYDLGLIAVSPEIMQKTGKLTRDERMQLNRHPLLGYAILSDNHAIPATSAAVALQHHENQDGTGYPRNICGENRPPLKDFSRKNMIHRFAEIVAVADRYDMMTAGRLHFAKKVPVRKAVSSLITMAGPVLNSEVVKKLLTIIPLYPVGTRVRIAHAPARPLTGYYGVIARDNPRNLEKPQIVLYQTPTKKKCSPIFIDLALYEGFDLELVA